MAITAVAEPGIELDSLDTEQWEIDRFEAWRRSRKPAWWQGITRRHHREGTNWELVEFEADPGGYMKGKIRGRALTALHAKGPAQGTVLLIWRWATVMYSVSKQSWETATFLEMFQIPTKTSEYGC